MYHSIGSSDNEEEGAGLYCVPVDKFREQMELIKTWGQSPKGGDSPHLTFDDGLLDNYTNAFPILKDLGIKACFFILAGNVGKPGYMSWAQIKELGNAGMLVGSHGMTHKILVGLNQNEINYELNESKKILEEKLKITIEYFSIPKGHYNGSVIDNLKKVGYKAVFTSNPEDNDGFRHGRIMVKGNWDLNYFRKVMNNGLSLQDKVQETAKNTFKRIFGANRYDKFRGKILTTLRKR